MAMVEKYWDDVTVYYVEFIASDKNNELRDFCKTLVFSSEIEACEIPKIVKTRFLNIVDVTVIDERFDGLLLKDNYLASH